MTHSVQQQKRGFTLIESIISILVVGVMFVSSMSVLSQSRISRFVAADGLQGQLLAEELMNEIMQQSYQEPVDVFGSLGVDVGEAPGVRVLWDDIDDYDGWTASPPQDKNGVAMTGVNGWTRSVVVGYANRNNLNNPVGVDVGMKIIIVVVMHEERQVAKLYAVRTGVAQSVFDRLGHVKLAVK